MKKVKITEFIKTKWPVLLIIAAIVAVLIYTQSQSKVTPDSAPLKPAPMPVIETPKFYRSLDGRVVESAEKTNPQVFGVMVENNIEAWPLSGLDSASVVYEALAESRIPRFLALFTSDDAADKIGPVRSVRPYYAELAKPFDPIFMHVGGSPDGLAKLKSLGVFDMNEFFWGGVYFWRDKIRSAPHNTYTSQEMMKSLLTDKKIEPSPIVGWNFKDPLQRSADEIAKFIAPKDIIVNYTDNTYQARYTFDSATGRYHRYQAKEPMKLLSGKEIWADNVIIEEHNHKVLDEIGRKEIDLIGTGKAWVFRDGELVAGTWSKKDDASLTKYLDADGKEIALNRGTTWINIVEPNSFNY